MPATTYYAIKMDGRFPSALVLTPKARQSEKCDGFFSAEEIHQHMRDNFGNVQQLPASRLRQKVEQRLTHTPEIIALLKRDGDLLGQDLSKCFVYGSYNRPMSSIWARIEDAVYVQSDKYRTGYHTYVAVPALLDDETISRYELELVSHA